MLNIGSKGFPIAIQERQDNATMVMQTLYR
jgi:hypothetical protein